MIWLKKKKKRVQKYQVKDLYTNGMVQKCICFQWASNNHRQYTYFLNINSDVKV